MKKRSLFLPLAFLFLLSSCGMMDDLRIEKRRYNKGFYVHKRDNRSTAPVRAAETQEPADETAMAAQPEQQPSTAATSDIPGFAPAPQMLPAAGHQTYTVILTPEAGKQSAAPARPPVKQKVRKLQQAVAKKSPAPLQAAGDINLVLLVIIALLLPPLAIWVKEQTSNRFWIDLICWILGVGVVFTPFFWGGALWLFAVLFALLIVLDVI